MNRTLLNTDPEHRKELDLFRAYLAKNPTRRRPLNLGRFRQAGMADTPLWRDLRSPIQVTDLPTITLTTTQKMLWAPGAANPLGNFPVNYWKVQKTVELTAALKWTSGTAG